MYTITCKKCEKSFYCKVMDMCVPGGKEREYIYCPYCREKNGSEITSGFVHTDKLEEKPNN